MDARTFNKENEVPAKVHVNFIAFVYHSLGGQIIFDTVQKWYYYSLQTTKEVLVFHQYTKVWEYYANSVRMFNKKIILSGQILCKSPCSIWEQKLPQRYGGQSVDRDESCSFLLKLSSYQDLIENYFMVRLWISSQKQSDKGY